MISPLKFDRPEIEHRNSKAKLFWPMPALQRRASLGT